MNNTYQFPVFTEITGNVLSAVFLVTDYQSVNLQINGTNSPDYVVKVRGSQASKFEQPDFTSDPYAYKRLRDDATGNVYAGATGYTFTGTDAVVDLEVDVTQLVWMAVEITGYNAGDGEISIACAGSI